MAVVDNPATAWNVQDSKEKVNIMCVYTEFYVISPSLAVYVCTYLCCLMSLCKLFLMLIVC